jgi:hypothetical protein
VPVSPSFRVSARLPAAGSAFEPGARAGTSRLGRQKLVEAILAAERADDGQAEGFGLPQFGGHPAQ